jgi:hypothetical protein
MYNANNSDLIVATRVVSFDIDFDFILIRVDADECRTKCN